MLQLMCDLYNSRFIVWGNKMKSLLKPLLLSATLSAIGLSCTISYASASLSSDGIERSVPSSVRDSVLANTNAVGGIVNRPFNSFEYLINKPLFQISINEISSIGPLNFNDTPKKNEIFEVAAIFNDKLQLFLAYFDEDPLAGQLDNEINSAVLSDKKCDASAI